MYLFSAIETHTTLNSDSLWLPSMDYSDEFFESGQAMIDYLNQELDAGAKGSVMKTYHACYLMYKNVWHHFKTKDIPNVMENFQHSYEEIRRSMMDLSLPKTLYGPTNFDHDRRNVGRGSASSQWIPATDSYPSGAKSKLLLISPIDQAEINIVYPAPVSVACPAGSYINETLALTSDALLESKCEKCPMDTFQSTANSEFSCRPCEDKSTTNGETGAEICVEYSENLVPSGMLIFGLFIVGVNFLLAIIFASWTWVFKNDPVVKLGQKDFLLMICAGSFLSSSSIIPLSFQAGLFEDTTAASSACMAVPWLYSTGWILQYSSLFAKSYRMYKVMKGARRMRQTTVTAKQTLSFVFAALLLNWAIIIPWT